ncbi:MAG: MarR family transcriptional regulator, partial [Actinobacteria bacterium]|nr:MarR family transcriptional regulator [Actinomycetota bacterium]
LELAGSRSMSDFAAGMHVSPPAATEMVERLEERGLLVREHDRADRRVITVRLSRAAAAEARAVLARRRRDLQRALQRVPEVPPAVVLAFMTALIEELRTE